VRRARAAIGVVGQPAARAGVGASGVTVRSGQRGGDVGAGAEAGIDETLLLQPIQRLGIEGGPPGLSDRLAVVGEAKPGEVLENAGDELRAASAGIEILDSDEKPAAAGARMGMAQRRRKGMAKMQSAGRRWGETCDLQDSLHDKGACRGS
jgi:hypothetical protein